MSADDVDRWHWVEASAVFAIHDFQIAEHGGSDGVRDRGAIESAPMRPVNLALYAEPDAADLAAPYAYGLAKNHGFVDGNREAESGRTALAADHDASGSVVRSWLTSANPAPAQGCTLEHRPGARQEPATCHVLLLSRLRIILSQLGHLARYGWSEQRDTGKSRGHLPERKPAVEMISEHDGLPIVPLRPKLGSGTGN